LNLAWLERYFYVEPEDIRLLGDCERAIIDEDGFIFFAEYDDRIVGCFALLRLDDKRYELGKMAVGPAYQGLKIGQKLLSFAITFAKKNRWHSLILYSSTKLDTALHIYRKYGFREVVLEREVLYARSDIKMELRL
jgi:GNAT superfamily N-acetyltransferase